MIQLCHILGANGGVLKVLALHRCPRSLKCFGSLSRDFCPCRICALMVMGSMSMYCHDGLTTRRKYTIALNGATLAVAS